MDDGLARSRNRLVTFLFWKAAGYFTQTGSSLWRPSWHEYVRCHHKLSSHSWVSSGSRSLAVSELEVHKVERSRAIAANFFSWTIAKRKNSWILAEGEWQKYYFDIVQQRGVHWSLPEKILLPGKGDGVEGAEKRFQHSYSSLDGISADPSVTYSLNQRRFAHRWYPYNKIVSALMARTRYKGYLEDKPLISWFWSILLEFDQKMLN